MVRPLFIPLLLSLVVTMAFAQKPCERLKELKLSNVLIASASIVPEGAAEVSTGNSTLRKLVPEHCAVQAIAKPTSDSEIRFEVWLPVKKWNGKYLQRGNGGWAGTIPKDDMAGALIRGYAVAGTDDGHKASFLDAKWIPGHPEKLIDFAYRAVHETNVNAHLLMTAFYGKDAQRNYFYGCSDGGREALMEAQRFPEDFDGIVVGAPANNWSHLSAGIVWNEQALLGTPASAIPPAKLPAIQKAALDACDALDGVRDKLIENPQACHFDPDILACKQGTDTNDCLTPPQLSALKKVYGGLKDPRNGKQVLPGWAVGTENGEGGWNMWIASSKPESALQFLFADGFYSQAVYEQPSWDFRSMTFTDDLDFADRKAGWILNSTNPDLRSFRDHHG